MEDYNHISSFKKKAEDRGLYSFLEPRSRANSCDDWDNVS